MSDTLGAISSDFSWGGFYAIAHQVIGMRVEQSFKWLKNGEKSREVNEFSCISTLLWFRFEILELQHRLNELLWRDASDVTSELWRLTLLVRGRRLEIIRSVSFFFFRCTYTNLNVQIGQICARAARTDATLRVWLPRRFCCDILIVVNKLVAGEPLCFLRHA